MFALLFFFKLYIFIMYIYIYQICSNMYEILHYKCLGNGVCWAFLLEWTEMPSLSPLAWTHHQIWFPSLSECMHTDRSSQDTCPTIVTCHLSSPLFGRCLDRWLHCIGLWRILISLCSTCPAQFTKPLLEDYGFQIPAEIVSGFCA